MLIEKLNALSHLPPDQIVAKLHDGWINLMDMSEADFDRLNNIMCVVGSVSRPRGFWIVNGTGGNWRFCRGPWIENQRLGGALYGNFWFIPLSEYEDGSVPHRYAHQQSG